eukprot:359543-Chlamydomonas_euryale.AAC.3
MSKSSRRLAAARPADTKPMQMPTGPPLMMPGMCTPSMLRSHVPRSVNMKPPVTIITPERKLSVTSMRRACGRVCVGGGRRDT